MGADAVGTVGDEDAAVQVKVGDLFTCDICESPTRGYTAHSTWMLIVTDVNNDSCDVMLYQVAPRFECYGYEQVKKIERDWFIKNGWNPVT